MKNYRLLTLVVIASLMLACNVTGLTTPPTPIVVEVTRLVPADTPVTKPALLTVATPVDDETQGFMAAAVPEPVNWVVEPAKTVNVPVIVGNALTIKV